MPELFYYLNSCIFIQLDTKSVNNNLFCSLNDLKVENQTIV